MTKIFFVSHLFIPIVQQTFSYLNGKESQNYNHAFALRRTFVSFGTHFDGSSQPFKQVLLVLVLRNELGRQKGCSLKTFSHMFSLGCPTTYSCHVDSVLLNSKFEANRSEYWNSKFKYSQIEYSNIFRRTWCFQISFLMFEDS